jgi:hypothetical protein
VSAPSPFAALSLSLFAALALAGPAAAQSRRRPTARAAAAHADEAALRRALAEQPDYTAVLHFFFDEGFGGFGATSRVARLGRRTRDEDESYVFLHEPGRPTVRLDPARREYAEMPEDEEGKGGPVTPEAMAASGDVTFRALGETKVGAYACRRIEVRYRDARLKGMRHVFCVAPSLKNLIVFQRTFLPPVTMTRVLSDVSLGAPAELFRVPEGYAKVTAKSPEAEMKEMLDRIKPPSPSATTTPPAR